jgi:hypothetical protein
MGSIIGGVIGGVGSLFGGSSASNQALAGYNYLTNNPTNQLAQNFGQAATQGANATQNTEAQLLGTQPMTNATQNGFNNYLNSTGYNFQQQQGTAALTGSAAARGILNSGSTAKALQGYGQNLASTSFNNYLGNLSGLNTQQQNAANTGVNAASQVGTAGTQGGATAAQATYGGIAGATGAAVNVADNFFGGI